MLNLLLALLALPLLLAFFAFALILREYILDRRATRYNLLYRFNADSNGNYPVYFDLIETYYRPEPGNPGQPGSYQVNVQPPNKHFYHDMPIVVNPARNLPKEQEAEQLPPASRNFIEAVSSEISETSLETRDILTAAKKRGDGKIAALASIGLKPGKGKEYQFWSKEWELL